MAAAAFALWRLWPARELPPAPLLRQEWFALAAATIVFAFPLLVCRRIVADVPPARLPEAPRLERLLAVPIAFLLALAALDIAGGLGLGSLPWLRLVLGIGLAALIGELAIRPQALWFLPPPDPREAIAAIDSLLARLLDPQARSIATLGEALTERFGLDFSRSWALAYVRGALAPFALGMMLIVWMMSGVTAINFDERGSYERLGAPTAILKPGLHLLLPWPLGIVRRVEYGVVHSVSIGYGAPENAPAGTPPSAAVAEASVRAEDIPPAGLGRLWDAALPSDVTYLIASRSREAQSFETISAGLRVSYRIGLDDESARRALYRTSDAETLVRMTLRRLLAHFLATQTLSDVLVEDRASIANGLQQKLQAALDGFDSGIEIVAVVVEALQPPSGAAAAYHNVQAAEILAKTQVATERGRAQSTASIAQRDAKEMTDKAEADGAELLGEARTQRLQFTADEVAYRVGGPAFLFERYLGNLRTTLKDSGLEIIDHRLAGPDGATFDLRPNLGKPGMPPPIEGIGRTGQAAVAD
jgi:regulator of protease activity HflC (stomatin/prohibitin superfamily)